MDKWNKIWVLEHFGMDDCWEALAYFSTKEKAEEYLEVIKKEDDDLYDETSEFRYDWHYVDKGYFE